MTASQSFCRICEVSCGSLVEVTPAGVKVSPDRDNPYSSGYFCRKGLRADFVEEDPDRLREPRIRRNGKLETSSWAETFDYLGPRLRNVAEQYGPNSIGVFSGNSKEGACP